MPSGSSICARSIGFGACAFVFGRRCAAGSGWVLDWWWLWWWWCPGVRGVVGAWRGRDGTWYWCWWLLYLMWLLLLESVGRGDVVAGVIAVVVETRSSRRDSEVSEVSYAACVGFRALMIAALAIRSETRVGCVPEFHTEISCRRRG